MKYFLETSVCVDIIRGRNARLLERITKLPTTDFGVSIITVAELRVGAEKSSRPSHQHNVLNEFLSALEVVYLDINATIAYGKIRGKLESNGTPIGALDTLIAAHAVSCGVVLLTHNLKEFKRVPGLKVEDWTKP